MADAVQAIEGYLFMLDALTQDLVVQVRLYTNDPVLRDTTTSLDFVQPAYAGYGAQPATRWTRAAYRGVRAFSSSDPIYFRWTAGPDPLPIRGYYAVEPGSQKLLWAWRKPGDAFPLGAANPLLTILPILYWPCRSM